MKSSCSDRILTVLLITPDVGEPEVDVSVHFLLIFFRLEVFLHVEDTAVHSTAGHEWSVKRSKLLEHAQQVSPEQRRRQLTGWPAVSHTENEIESCFTSSSHKICIHSDVSRALILFDDLGEVGSEHSSDSRIVLSCSATAPFDSTVSSVIPRVVIA